MERFPQFNDGIVRIYKKINKKTDFNARNNVQSYDDMEQVVKLNFQQMSKRNQDIEFAEKMSFNLSMKIRTRKFKKINSKQYAVIDGFLFEIKYIDEDKTSSYLYLEGVRDIVK